MNEADLTKLRELSVLLDLAYMHHFDGETGRYKSAEGAIRLEFGNYWYRKSNPASPNLLEGPQIESVIVYSSVFSAARVSYFDTLDDAIEVVKTWYEQAKERSSNES